MADDSTDVFPRISVKDPYKRLGISREAAEEEIQASRNFLINKYGGHKPSVDAIESAHDKIIMQSFYDRENPKINFKKKMRKVSQSRVVKVVSSRFEIPATNVIIKTAIAFVVLGVLTVLFPTEEGPTLQVAISLIGLYISCVRDLRVKFEHFYMVFFSIIFHCDAGILQYCGFLGILVIGYLLDGFCGSTAT